jgi:hypothetical protein
VEQAAERRLPSLPRRHPRALDPRRNVAHVLEVAACELGHPVTLVVAVKAGDRLVDASRPFARAALRRGERERR